MVLAGFCISRTGVDIALVSAEDGALQESASTPLQLDPVVPDADALVVPFASLTGLHPAELTVLAISTQVVVKDEYNMLPKIGFTTYDRSTIDYLSAYVAGLTADEVANAPELLFIEITHTSFIAQMVTIRLDGTKRTCLPIYVEAATSSTTTLPTFLGQVFAWALGHNHKLFQCVFLDPPLGSVDGTALQTTLTPDCPLIIVDGRQLGKGAASYAFLDQEYLRDPEDELGQYFSACPISFVANNIPPTVIIHRSERLPRDRTIIFMAPEGNQTSITIKFALGTHDIFPDDRLIFAKLTLEGLHPRPAGEGQITISTYLSHEWGNIIGVFQGSETKNADVRLAIQIPSPSLFPAYAVFRSMIP
ncbi:hypothetical protein M413DRAFT_28223 [Hebeloma cylindrosporum]|uniref:Uncharacterized protein n=1 Tax=Hebeloma cylindrosporum TaxID=76867 RepID=A0A0C2XU50_HEBCY|nr:hypothetical protein M413DRAFT_28223 [Hebeloma cylindrosporum h7]